MKSKPLLILLVCCSIVATQTGFWGKRKDEDPKEKDRQEVRDMRDEVLEELYKLAPDARKDIAKAEGYAVFSNVGVNLIIASAAGGSGMAVDNKSGDETFMRMASVGIGIGLGVKDFRGIFIFYERKAFENFVEHGWDFSGQADAAAKSGEKGGEVSVEATVIPGVRIYQITKNGLALQATLQGTKYWKNASLNK